MPDGRPPVPGSTSELLARWHAGDAVSLDDLLRQELPFVRQLALRRLGERARTRLDASDCVQEAVIDFLRYGPRVVPADQHQFRGLLARIVENNLHDHDDWFRARRRQAAREQPLDSAAVLSLDPAMAQPSSPSTGASRDEQRAWVRLALELIEPRDRRLLVRRDWDRASFAEIGAELGIDENAARSRWVRAVGRLADRIVELRSGRLGRALRDESLEAHGDAG
jgi:RNA polymerase sigma factor (sigma-70 family)